MTTGPLGDKPSLYTELSELNKIRQMGQDDNPEALRKVAEQFEQIFLSMLMKSMREANRSFGEDNFLNSSQVQFYEGMLDEQMSLELAGKSGIGLSDVLVKQLTRDYGDAASSSPTMGSPMSASTDPAALAQQMMDRTMNTTASLAASAVLGKAQKLPQLPPGVNAAQAILEANQPSTVTNTASTTGENSQGGMAVNFDSPEGFVQSLMPVATEVATEIGVDPKVLLAQAALETGWGRYVIGQGSDENSHNLFNIKADSRWSGERVAAQTTEFVNGQPVAEVAQFRAYESYEESFRDYVRFIQSSPRYADALNQAHDPQGYIGSLQQAGYATDPEYAAKISRIFNSSILNTAQAQVEPNDTTEDS
ncbi:MAG: flagellar assembly peptidoglycan hydrolase FlgJ [Pontibacterium sp.]